MLIPAFNEEARVALTIEGLKKIDQSIRIVVVDDGSQDKTACVAKEAGAEVITFSFNLGKGKALRQAWERLGSAPWAAVAFIDADVGSTSSEAAKLLEPVLKGEADMVIGALSSPSKKGGFGLVKKLASWGIARLTGYSTRVPLSGQRAMQPFLLNELVMEDGFGLEVALTVDALRKGYRLLEVPVQMSHAATGRDLRGFIHRGKQFFQVMRALGKRFFQKRKENN